MLFKILRTLISLFDPLRQFSQKWSLRRAGAVAAVALSHQHWVDDLADDDVRVRNVRDFATQKRHDDVVTFEMVYKSDQICYICHILRPDI